MTHTYTIIVEQTVTGFSAYAPDLPGCMETGATCGEVERSMREAVEFHLDGLRKDGVAVPSAHTYATTIEIVA